MFQKDEHVFYESEGICKIFDICTSPLEGMPADREYYVMQSVHDRNGMIYIPVDNDKVFMRHLLDREEAEHLIDHIPQVDAIDEPNSKMLRTKYLEAMQTHLPMEWVRVIKTVYRRASSGATGRVQRLSETERLICESAKRYLYTELSLALDLDVKNIEAYIAERIEKMA